MTDFQVILLLMFGVLLGVLWYICFKLQQLLDTLHTIPYLFILAFERWLGGDHYGNYGKRLRNIIGAGIRQAANESWNGEVFESYKEWDEYETSRREDVTHTKKQSF